MFHNNTYITKRTHHILRYLRNDASERSQIFAAPFWFVCSKCSKTTVQWPHFCRWQLRPTFIKSRMVSFESHNIFTSGVRSAKRTLRWIGRSRSFKVTLICVSRNPERIVVIMLQRCSIKKTANCGLTTANLRNAFEYQEIVYIPRNASHLPIFCHWLHGSTIARSLSSVRVSVNFFAQIASTTPKMAQSRPNLHRMVCRWARIKVVLKVKVKVKRHVIRALLCWT